MYDFFIPKTETFRKCLEENISETYLIGIDIGTSGCKIAVFNKAGEVLAAQSGTYPVYYPKPGWAEQNPEDWWNTICQGLPEMLQKAEISPDEIAGIGIDG